MLYCNQWIFKASPHSKKVNFRQKFRNWDKCIGRWFVFRSFRNYMIFYPTHFFWLKILMISIIYFLKKQAFFRTNGKSFPFFLGLWFFDFISKIFCPVSFNIYKFFLFERARQDAGHRRALFLIKLCFLLYIQTFMLLDTHFWRVFWLIELVISFLR